MNLSHNRIGEKSQEYIDELLSKNYSLISLDLRGNLVQDTPFVTKLTKRLIRNILRTKKPKQAFSSQDSDEREFIKEIMSEVLIQSSLDSMALAALSTSLIS